MTSDLTRVGSHPNGNIYESDISHFPVDIQELLEVKTYYEQMWLAQGDTIKYVQFKLNGK